MAFRPTSGRDARFRAGDYGSGKGKGFGQQPSTESVILLRDSTSFLLLRDSTSAILLRNG